jgi:predicted nucleic acid-binding protein
MEEIRLVNVLFDVNLLLDVFLEREPWVAEARALWIAHHRRRVVGHIAAHGVTNLFYVARKVIGLDQAREAVRLSLQTFVVVPIGRPELELADSLPGNDNEDNLVAACASLAGLDAIITRDPKGFVGSLMPVLSPTELPARLPKDDPGEADRERGPSGVVGSPEPRTGPRTLRSGLARMRRGSLGGPLAAPRTRGRPRTR